MKSLGTTWADMSATGRLCQRESYCLGSRRRRRRPSILLFGFSTALKQYLRYLTSPSKISVASCEEAVLVEVRVVGDRVAVLADTLEVFQPARIDFVLVNEAILGNLMIVS